MRNTELYLDIRGCDPRLAPPGLQLLCVAEVQAYPNDTYDRPSHDHHTIEYVVSGRGTLSVRGRSYEVGPGDAFVLPLDEPHIIRADPRDPWRKRFANVLGPLLPTLLDTYGLSGRLYFPRCDVGAELRGLIDSPKAHEELHHEAAMTILAIIQRLYTSAQSAQRADPPYPTSLRRAQAYIDEHLTAPISVEEIATAVGCSASYLSRLFRNHLGCTPWGWLLHRRMKQAQLVLANTTLPLKLIADRYHYADASGFSNAFKREVGCSPSDWRRNAAGPVAVGDGSW